MASMTTTTTTTTDYVVEHRENIVDLGCLCTSYCVIGCFLVITSAGFFSRFVTWLVAVVFSCLPLFALFVYLKFSCPLSLLFSLWHWAQECSIVVYLNRLWALHSRNFRTTFYTALLLLHTIFYLLHQFPLCLSLLQAQNSLPSSLLPSSSHSCPHGWRIHQFLHTFLQKTWFLKLLHLEGGNEGLLGQQGPLDYCQWCWEAPCVDIECLCTLVVLCGAFAVITSAVSFPGWSGDWWLLYYIVFPCLLCLYSWNFHAQSLFTSVSDTGHKVCIL